MADVLFPPWVRVSASKPKQVTNTAVSRSIFTGAARTLSRTGDRWRLAFGTQNAVNQVSAPERAALKSFIGQTRGQANRVWAGMPGYVQRGSFPATELLTNNTFANGTAGWTASSATLTVNDRVLRLTATSLTGTVQFYRTSAAITQYAPYAIRSMLIDGAQTSALSLGRFISAGNNNAYDYSTARGLGIIARVTDSASSEAQFPAVVSSTSGFTAGAYTECAYSSYTRCFLVDNGPNLLTYSDQFDNAAWTKSAATVTANETTAPDGTVTADALEETTASSAHYVIQQSTVAVSALDYAFACALKSNGRQWSFLRMSDSVGSTQVYQTFDLTNGVLGSTSSVGANWSNLRSFIRALGNGWYYCCIVARKTNAATGVSAWIGPSSGDNVSSYVGIAGTGIRVWRATLAQSSVPTRLVQTTSAALPTGTAQTGSNLYVKGGPASASGSLLAGDLVQVGNQLQQLTASLDFDAVGLGYLQMHRPMRTAPADNDPVIVNNPMGRFICTSNENGWDDVPGQFSDFEFDMEEALDQ